MPKMIFVNLPVANLERSTAFYQAIGCTKDARFSNEIAVSMVWSDTITFMLLTHDFYRTFTPKQIIDARATSGALFALSFDTREAVDSFAEDALAAGGREAHGAKDMGFMYGRRIEDPDGHGFEPMWMDVDAAIAAMPKAEATDA